MSTNQPPPTTPNNESNSQTTPSNQNTSHIPVVTQPSQLTQEFNAASDTPAREEIHNQHHTYSHDWLIEHAETNPSPILEPSRVPLFPTPTNHSPVISKASSRRMMDEASNSTIERAAAARIIISLSNTTKRKVHNPKTAILSFLRDKRFNHEMSILESTGSSTFNISSVVGLAKRSFYNQRNISVKNLIFKDFKKEMDKLSKSGLIGFTLSMCHHRLLIEDIMGIKSEKKEYILLIHQDHKFLHQERETWWSRRIKSIGINDTKGRCNYVRFETNLYYALKIKVRNNPRGEDLYRSMYTQKEISDGCTKQGGWGIGIILANGERKDILFHDFLESPLQLQLWSLGGTTDYKRIQQKLRTLSTISLSATVKCLLTEAYGDSILTQDICHRYSTLITAKEESTITKAKAQALISTKRIKEHYRLRPDNDAFVKFRNTVNDKCMDIIGSTYGRFNTITDPLLSYTEVSKTYHGIMDISSLLIII
jgi:hypothetical protein